MNQNPWAVESLQSFYFLKCPECDFDTKEENSFENHATKSHPLSFVLFDKKYVPEDFDTINVKEEPLSHFDTRISHDYKKSFTPNHLSPLSYSIEDNSMLDVPYLKKELTDVDQNELKDNKNYDNNSEIKSYFADDSIIENNLEEAPLNSYMATVHEEKKQYKCVICRKTFGNEGILKAHISLVHKGIKVIFKCPDCNGSFSTSEELNEHHTASHVKFQCMRCSAGFFEKSHLDLHIRSVHEIIKPFRCSTCDKSFTTSKGLLCHKKTVHVEKKPFKCPYCKMTIPRITDLQEHVKTIHSSFQYNIKKIDQKHVKLAHEGAKLFTCFICKHGFEEEINLKSHIRMVHNGSKIITWK